MPDIFTSKKQDTLISPEEPKIEPQNIPQEQSGLPADPPKTEAQKIGVHGHSHSRWSSFSLYPDDIDFETKASKEQIILMLRQHPVVNLRWIVTSIFLLSGPTLLNLFGVFTLLPEGFSLVITLSWYLVTSAYAIEGFLDWYFNVYFITDQRIVDVDFYNLINKRVSNAEIEIIEDVSYTTGGVIRTLLNYGDVFIQTAAEVSEFDFYAVPNPERAVKILDDLRSKV